MSKPASQSPPSHVDIMDTYVVQMHRCHGSQSIVAVYDGVRGEGRTENEALGALVRAGAFGKFTILPPP